MEFLMRLLAKHSPAFDPSLPWVQDGETIRGESRLFQQVSAMRRSPHTNRGHEFTRLKCPEWANVIAFTPMEAGGELVVEQFRHGIDASTLEIIGGVCDEGEHPFTTAQRELLEETGHKSERWISLGSCTPNPATQNNHYHFYLALDCTSEAALDLDPSEELQLWAVPWKEWEEKLRNGEIHHALVLAAFLRLYYWEGWNALRASLERA
jgi:8-oxo-dGTP pyrophosphatase MutT (NUDIX family)